MQKQSMPCGSLLVLRKLDSTLVCSTSLVGVNINKHDMRAYHPQVVGIARRSLQNVLAYSTQALLQLQ